MIIGSQLSCGWLDSPIKSGNDAKHVLHGNDVFVVRHSYEIKKTMDMADGVFGFTMVFGDSGYYSYR